eukprot:SAG22_NODE_11_length_35583_cov_107.128790_22_plen_342_part_00
MRRAGNAAKVMSRSKSERLVGDKLIDAAVDALRSDPDVRSPGQVETLLAFLGSNIAQLQDLDPDRLDLHAAVCARLTFGRLDPNQSLCEQGQRGQSAFFMVDGSARVEVNGKIVKYVVGTKRGSGTVLCEDVLQHGDAAVYDRTVITMDSCRFAVLSRADYFSVLGRLEDEAMVAMQTPPNERTDHDLKLLQTMFRRSPFLDKLVFLMLQRHICRYLELQTAEAGEEICRQGEHGDHAYFLMRGEAKVLVNGVRVRMLSGEAADECGEMAVLGETEEEQRRTATIVAATPCVFGKVSRWHYTVTVQEIEQKVLVVLQVRSSSSSSSSRPIILRSLPFADSC